MPLRHGFDQEATQVARQLRRSLWRQLGLASPLLLAACTVVEVSDGGEAGGVTTNPSSEAAGGPGSGESSSSVEGPGEAEGPGDTDTEESSSDTDMEESSGEIKLDTEPSTLDVGESPCTAVWVDPETVSDEFPDCEFGLDPNLYPEVTEVCVERPPGEACGAICADELCDGMDACIYAPILAICGVYSSPDSCCVVIASEQLPPVGRPFLVAGEPRLAEIGAGEGDRFAQHWLDTARGEHASIAAFARFVATLQQYGAPASLVADAVSAAADEVRHAEFALDVAEAHAGHRARFGPLRIDGALAEHGSLALAVRAAVIEGCIGETLAAHEAACLTVYARDPMLIASLERIARDELRHAALAWRFVQWAIGREPSLLSSVRQTLAEATVPAAESEGFPDIEALAHGCPPPHLRRNWRMVAHRELVEPCAARLLTSRAVAASQV